MSDTYKPTEHGGLKQDGTPDKRVQQTEFAYGKVDPHEAGQKGGATTTSGSSEDSGTYKPTEHGGLKLDGTPDNRVNQENVTGSADNSSGSGSTYKPTEHGGLKKDGTPDGRVTQEHDNNKSNTSSGSSGGFAHGKVDPAEAGRKGGKASGHSGSD